MYQGFQRLHVDAYAAENGRLCDIIWTVMRFEVVRYPTVMWTYALLITRQAWTAMRLDVDTYMNNQLLLSDFYTVSAISGQIQVCGALCGM